MHSYSEMMLILAECRVSDVELTPRQFLFGCSVVSDSL